MTNNIKLIVAGAIAIAAFVTTSVQAQDQAAIVYGDTGSRSFVGSLKVTPAKYLEVTTTSGSVSATFNPVNLTGTLIDQGVSSSTSEKITNKTILEEISAPSGSSLVWQLDGSSVFAQGKLVALKITKTRSGTTYTITDVPVEVFSTEGLEGDLVTINSNSKTNRRTGVVTTTSNYSAGISGITLFDTSTNAIPVQGVGTVQEVDVSGGTPEIRVNATIPLSGTYIVVPASE